MGGPSRALVCLLFVVAGCQAAPTSWKSSTPPVERAPNPARRLQVWRVPAGGGIPPQLLVHWERGPRAYDLRQRGLDLWQVDRSGRRLIWRVRLARELIDVRVAMDDLTHDGHVEVLLQLANSGTGYCGPKRVIDTAHPRPVHLLRRWTCDTSFSIRHGRLVRSSGRYTPHDSHCCPTFAQRTSYRWDGRRLEEAGAALYWNCIERSCQAWRRGPLHFRPRYGALWDEHRGVAVGGARPWLFGRTTDGGRTWAIVDAAPCALGAPRLAPGGRASVRLRYCPTSAGAFRIARTRDFGRTWSAR